MRSPRLPRVLFGTASLVAVLAALHGCTKEEAAPAPAPSTPAPAPAAPATPAAEPAAPAADFKPGTASIDGEVKLEGNPPEMQPLKRGVDPVCAKQAMNDEQVLAKGGKLQNVAVWISEGVPAQPPPSTPAKLDQHQCMYRPRVQAIQDGQALEVHNSDQTLHNVRAVSDGKNLFNKAHLPRAAPILQTVKGGKVIGFKCDVHPWMKGFAVVVPHGFSAVTGEDGRFSIKGLPAGKYTVTTWHELFGTKTAQVSVEDGKAAPVSVTYSAQDRG